MLGGGGWGLG